MGNAESENWILKLADGLFLNAPICQQRIATCIEIQKMLQSILVKLKNQRLGKGAATEKTLPKIFSPLILAS